MQAHRSQPRSQMTAHFYFAKRFSRNRLLKDPHAGTNASCTPDAEAGAQAKTSGNIHVGATYHSKVQRAHWKQNRSPPA